MPGADSGITPRSIAVSEAGTVYVSQRSPARILVFDRAGAFVRSIGRAGEGPGEYRDPMIGVGHGHLYVHDTQVSRLTLLDTAGQLRWSRKAPCCLTMPVQVDGDGRAFVRKAEINFEGKDVGEEFLAVDSLGHDVMVLRRPAVPSSRPGAWVIVDQAASISVAIPFGPSVLRAVTADGSVLYGLSTEPALTLARGERRRQWRLAPMAPVAVTQKMRDTAIEMLIAQYEQFLPRERLRVAFRPGDVPSQAPAFLQLVPDRCGGTWVARTDGQADDVVTLDLLDSTGVHRTRVRARGRFQRRPMFAVGGGRLAAVMEDENGSSIVRVFDLDVTVTGCAR